MESFLLWCSEANLSRRIKDPGDDFSDGVLVAEIIHHYVPNLVDLETYQTTGQYEMKLINWKSLNRMVFKKLGFEASLDDLECVCRCQTTAVEQMLINIREAVDKYLVEEQRKKLFPAAKVKRDHLNQKLESIRNNYCRQRTSHSPEKTPLKKTRGNVLVLPGPGSVPVEKEYKIPPQTAPEFTRKSLGDTKAKEATSVTFNPIPVTSSGPRFAGQAEERVKSLEKELQEANAKITSLTEALSQAEQENSELKTLRQTYEANIQKILVELETLKEENLKKDRKLSELKQKLSTQSH